MGISKENIEKWKLRGRSGVVLSQYAGVIIKKKIQRKEIPKAIELKCLGRGNQAKEYHHSDYEKPLEVIPLCRECHGEIHNWWRKYDYS